MKRVISFLALTLIVMLVPSPALACAHDPDLCRPICTFHVGTVQLSATGELLFIEQSILQQFLGLQGRVLHIANAAGSGAYLGMQLVTEQHVHQQQTTGFEREDVRWIHWDKVDKNRHNH